MKLKALKDFSKYGYPDAIEDNKETEPYYDVRGIIVAITDTKFNVLDSYVGNRDDADELLKRIIEDRDELIVLDATQLRDDKLTAVKFIYLPYQNTLCTKWKPTPTNMNVEGYSADSGWSNEVTMEVMLSSNGLIRYVPLKFTSINLGMYELFENTLKTLESTIRKLKHNDVLDDEEKSLLKAFGLFSPKIGDANDDTLAIRLYNQAGEFVECDISGYDELKGIIASVRLLDVKAKEIF